MIKLDSGNVLLKPSHRRQVMTWLRRAVRLGQRVGKFMLTISMQRIGRSYEIRATAQDSGGVLRCRSRRHDWRDAVREMAREVERWVHGQQLERSAA
jgi:ribosome-associated translation inhibitor RaiA